MLAIADRDLLGLRLAVRCQGVVTLTLFHSLLGFFSLLPEYPFSPRVLAQAPVPRRWGGIKTEAWPRVGAGAWQGSVSSQH